MRLSSKLGSLLAGSAAAGLLLALSVAAAEEVRPSGPPSCTCPAPEKPPGLWPRPKFAEQRSALDEDDEIATLEAIRVALSEIGDGATYVLHRRNGRLSGMVRPTASFKDGAGKVCRHIVVILSTGTHSGRVEGVACRLADGRWQLDG